MWWGLFISAQGDFEGAEHAAVLGPIFITLLLLFVSGIPILEKSADMRHGHKEGYAEYKNRTSCLILFPPRLYERLPKLLKKTILLDFPLYNPGPPPKASPQLTGPTERTDLVPDHMKSTSETKPSQIPKAVYEVGQEL